MPIVVSRKTGQIISAPEYTQEQKDRCWEHIIRVWAQLHPDMLLQLTEQQPSCSDADK